MRYPTLQKGSTNRRDVRRLQEALTQAGHEVEIDGFFGKDTQEALKFFQRASDLEPDGIAEAKTWGEMDVIWPLESFWGDLGWVHQQEGHQGSPYWPGGDSGVTLDPGLDLGHADIDEYRQILLKLLGPSQLLAVTSVVGIRGLQAKAALKDLSLASIRISHEAASEIFPSLASPYWEDLCKRFPGLDYTTTPNGVQTAILSLGYNRGANNRHLGSLAEPLASGDYQTLARIVGSMQQGHRIRGIRSRRIREAQLISESIPG